MSAIDAGDVAELERLVTAHPALVRDRLDAPGAWLRDKVGDALDGFFQQPYLLWFVAEDPVRTGTLPTNIADITRAIIRAAQREGVETLQEQLDYALRLVSWSWIARDCNVQIGLMDVLIDAGASPDGNPDNALVNGNFAAAAHLVERGAQLDLGDGAVPGTLGRCQAARADRERSGETVRVRPGRAQGQGRSARMVIDLGVDLNAPAPISIRTRPPFITPCTRVHSMPSRCWWKPGPPWTRKTPPTTATPLGWAEVRKAWRDRPSTCAPDLGKPGAVFASSDALPGSGGMQP